MGEDGLTRSIFFKPEAALAWERDWKGADATVPAGYVDTCGSAGGGADFAGGRGGDVDHDADGGCTTCLRRPDIPGLHVLLANEFGGRRGHVTTLRAAALALGSETRVVAAPGRDICAAEIAPVCKRVLGAHLLKRSIHLRAPLGPVGSATWGGVLGGLGLRDPKKLRRGLAFWRMLIVEEDISHLERVAFIRVCSLRRRSS
jgi:hypothetical protein